MRKFALLAGVAALLAAPAIAQQNDMKTSAQPAQSQTAAPATTGMDAVQFVEKAAMAGRFEIQSSELAAERSRNDAVKQFAEQMVQDHRQATEKLTAAAGEADVDVAILDQARQMQTDSAMTGSTSGTVDATPGSNDLDKGTTGSIGGPASSAVGNAPGQNPTASAARGEHGSASRMQPGGLSAEHQPTMQALQQASDETFDKAYVDAQVDAHETAVELFTAYAQGGEAEPLKAFAAETLPTLEQHLEKIKQIQSGL